MITSNIAKPRCLIVTKDLSLRFTLNTVVPELGYVVDIAENRNDAMRLFMLHRHSLLLIESALLPNYPHRLVQFFKMAHRTPAVIIFSKKDRDLSEYSYFHDGVYEVVDIPFKIENLIFVIKRTVGYMKVRSKNLFLKDFLMHAGLAAPVLFLLLYFLTK
ncbi:hypothetical protein QA601_10600 [Chitinispirillales bacterium ANBcel5]|uniref:hypothetical protein n=1 Tax=Cellulosispirillum alkaliphilum TaxID=3039283 RepID=UPI002A528093|nr:hypothetical protein [Chitinispirillales bacterium ANBcel5]